MTATAAANIAQGYTSSDGDLVVGMAAALSPNSTTDNQIVERATTSNKTKFVGVVTTKDANLVTLTDKQATIVVATNGEAAAFVSNLNGAPKKGDYLVVSPLKGILMKAGPSDANAVGTALEDFPAAGAQSQQIISESGPKAVLVNSMRMQISPASIALSSKDANKTFLHNLGQSITGRSVSDWQVLSALVIFFLVLVIEGSLVYGAIHSSITALGRNPLSHDVVYKQLFQVLLAVLGVLAFGVSVIYAVLQV